MRDPLVMRTASKRVQLSKRGRMGAATSGSATRVCVLHKGVGRLLGERMTGGLAVAARAIPGDLRIGRGSADRSLFPSIEFCRTPRGGRPIADKPNLGSLGERLDATTVAIISGNPNATYPAIAYDLSDVLDDGDNFRILPVIGKGGAARFEPRHTATGKTRACRSVAASPRRKVRRSSARLSWTSSLRAIVDAAPAAIAPRQVPSRAWRQ